MSETTDIKTAKSTILVSVLKIWIPAVLAAVGSGGYASMQSSDNDHNLRTAYELLAESNNRLIDDQTQDREDIATLKAENQFLKDIVLSSHRSAVPSSGSGFGSGAGRASSRRTLSPAHDEDSVQEPEFNEPPAEMIQEALDKVVSARNVELKQLPTKAEF